MDGTDMKPAKNNMGQCLRSLFFFFSCLKVKSVISVPDEALNRTQKITLIIYKHTPFTDERFSIKSIYNPFPCNTISCLMLWAFKKIKTNSLHEHLMSNESKHLKIKINISKAKNMNLETSEIKLASNGGRKVVKCLWHLKVGTDLLHLISDSSLIFYSMPTLHNHTKQKLIEVLNYLTKNNDTEGFYTYRLKRS